MDNYMFLRVISIKSLKIWIIDNQGQETNTTHIIYKEVFQNIK